MNLGRVGHKLSGVLHMCVREQSEMRRSFVGAVGILLGGAFVVTRGLA